MTQTFTTRFTAILLAAAIVAAAWMPTITVPLTAEDATLVTAVA